MTDYSKGQIYTIRNRNDDKKIYVGSTLQPLHKRFHQHKINSKKEKCMNRLFYVEVNDNWENWYIELYENFPCNNRTELNKKEGEVIRLIGTLNKNIAGRDDEQYRIDNIDKIKQYRIENADKLKEKAKQYRIDNADNKKEIDKRYYENNAERIKENTKQYYINNFEKRKEYMRQYYLKKKNEKTKETD